MAFTRAARCPVLVGREREVTILARAIGRLGEGAGSVTVLAGEAGIGKTRLAQRASELAGQAGVRVTVGRSDAAFSASPFRPLSEALLMAARGRPVPEADTLRPYVAVLASLVPHWRAPGWRLVEESPLVVGEALLRVLGDLAAPRGLLMIVEDLHWADEASMEVLGFLTGHVRDQPLAVVATLRTGEARDQVAGQLEARGAETCRLGRLTDEQTAAMARACLGPPGAPSVPNELVLRVARAAEGLPLLVEDLLASGESGGEPRRYANTVRARLARLNPSDRASLSAAAILGRQFDWRVVAEVTGLTAAAVTQALARCASSQLVTAQPPAYQFRHALTREVILGEISLAERQQMSLAAADAMARTPSAGAAPGEVGIGRDLEVGRLLSEGGEHERAARVLHDAGRRALAAGALTAAEPTLRAASACTAEDGELGIGIGCDLARVLLLAGQPAAAGQLAARLAGPAALLRRDLAACLLLLRARAALAAGRWDDAAACLRQLPEGDRVGATAAEAVLLSAQIALGDSTPGSRAGAEHQAAQAVALARQAGRPDLECEALEVMGLCGRLRDLNAAALALREALRLAEDAGLGPQHLHVLNELGTVEMLRDARGDRLEQARADALRAGALGLAAGIELNLAAVLTMTARFDGASAVAGAAGQTAGRLGLRPIEAASQMLLGLIAAYQGRRRDMDRRLAAAEALAPDDADLRAGAWGLGRGMLALLEEDRPAAIRAFARARAEAPDQHARILNPYQGPELLLQALAGQVTAGQVEQAAASAVRAARWPQLWAGTTLAIVRGADGDQPGDGQALAAALEAGDRYPIFCAIAQRLAGEAALRDKWGDPVALLRSADATFTRFGVRRAAAACQGLLRAAGQRAPRRRSGDAGLPAGLLRAGVTRREAEVLDLVADRLTNPEIAQRLYLSPRTVEKHVAALMLKLGAADRATLAELARAAPHNGGNLPMCPALRPLIIKHMRSVSQRRAPWPSSQSSSSPTTRLTSTRRSSRPAGRRSWNSRAGSTTSATGPRPGSPWWTCGRTSSPSPPSARSSARPPSKPGWTPSRWSTPSRA